MDLKELERFVATAEHGGIAAAADRLAISQPALTRSIQLLEQAFGGALFDRLPRGVRLTALGTRILPYARLMMRDRARLQEAVDEFNGVGGGLIAVGVTSNLLDGIAAEAVIEFRKKHPDVRVAVSGGLIGELLEMVQDGSLDLALCTLGSHAVPQRIRFEPLFETMTSIVVRQAHPLAAAQRVSFQQLSDANWIVMGGSASIEGLVRTFMRHGAAPPVHAIRSESSSFVRSCVLRDDYVAMLDQRCIAGEIASGAIRVLTTDKDGVSLASGLIYRNETPHLPAINGFKQVVRRCARSA